MKTEILIIASLLLLFLLMIVGLVALIRSSTKRKGKMGINFQPGNCPKCDTKLPAFRCPSSFRQAMWGGWTCQNCGAELDKWARPIDTNEVSRP